MCPRHDTPCVLPEARDNTSWSASLTHWTADIWPLISPESQRDPAAHSLAPAGSPGSQLTQQYCVMLSCESLNTSAPPFHSGNQCQTKWTVRPCVCRYVCANVCRLSSSKSSWWNNYDYSDDYDVNNYRAWVSVLLLHISLLIQTLISPYVDTAKLRGMRGGRFIEKIERLFEQTRRGGHSERAHLCDP